LKEFEKEFMVIDANKSVEEVSQEITNSISVVSS
jgi:thymidylate kinase